MHAEEAQPSSGSIPDQSPLPAESGPIRSHEAGVKGGSRLPLWLLTAGAGLVAGLLAALGGEAIGRAIPLSVKYPPEYAKMGGYQKEAVRSMALGQAEQVQEQQKAAAAYGLLGLPRMVCQRAQVGSLHAMSRETCPHPVDEVRVPRTGIPAASPAVRDVPTATHRCARKRGSSSAGTG